MSGCGVFFFGSLIGIICIKLIWCQMISGDIRYPKFNVYIRIFLWLLCPCVPFWFLWLAIPSYYTKSSFLLDLHQIITRYPSWLQAVLWVPFLASKPPKKQRHKQPMRNVFVLKRKLEPLRFVEVFVSGHVGHMWGCEILPGDVGGLFS